MDMLNAVKTDITAEDYFRAKFVIEEKNACSPCATPSWPATTKL